LLLLALLAGECAVIRDSMGWRCGWIRVEHRSSTSAYTGWFVRVDVGNVVIQFVVGAVGTYTSYVICLRRYGSPVYNLGMTFLINLVCVPCQDLGQTFSYVESHNWVLSRSTALLLPILHLRDSCLRVVGVPKRVAFEFVKRVKHS